MAISFIVYLACCVIEAQESLGPDTVALWRFTEGGRTSAISLIISRLGKFVDSLKNLWYKALDRVEMSSLAIQKIQSCPLLHIHDLA